MCVISIEGGGGGGRILHKNGHLLLFEQRVEEIARARMQQEQESPAASNKCTIARPPQLEPSAHPGDFLSQAEQSFGPAERIQHTIQIRLTCVWLCSKIGARNSQINAAQSDCCCSSSAAQFTAIVLLD